MMVLNYGETWMNGQNNGPIRLPAFLYKQRYRFGRYIDKKLALNFGSNPLKVMGFHL